jgi:hypothetical protein
VQAAEKLSGRMGSDPISGDAMPSILFKGPFESAGCLYKEDGWVTTDLTHGQRVKWCPSLRQAYRWDVMEGQ